MRISDWSSDVCSSDLIGFHYGKHHTTYLNNLNNLLANDPLKDKSLAEVVKAVAGKPDKAGVFNNAAQVWNHDFYRSEEHTSELQSLMRISYAVFCLKQKQIDIPATKASHAQNLDSNDGSYIS